MILVIDDDAAIRASLTLTLSRAGHEVKAVATPAEAIAFVRNTAPRLIMMDMNFSIATDGAEGLTLLKQVKIFQPQVPVVLMTAWGSIQLAVEGIKAGAADFALGKAAMFVQGTWASNTIMTTNPDMQLGVFALPINED
ncbi:MAG: response regulator, partial [Muribaculaceae bacterium]|nr:response regulator [Muribaculaceae bacterium]